MSDNQLSFKISSGLKNIIGKDLITDDFIAVFELVKNSFDAYAKNVSITFTGDTIVIADDGKGMDIEDIKNKWLFVAYSAKKEGTEDEELSEKEYDNYRDKIQAKKIFAGAKGIGRFSCDRLGRKLILTTKKASNFSVLEQIEVNWDDFEKDSTNTFVDIKVKHRTLIPTEKKLKKLNHGTIIEILQLNSKWDRLKKISLKHSLEKLINPFEDNPLNGFSITIHDDAELEDDKKESIKRNRVNGEVKNFVFETLKLKTTEILTDIDERGEYITTTINDRGTLIYKVRRKNNTNPKLTNIKYHLFHLNRSAKINFKKIMGIDNVNFGSVFLYKNGFRIAPYGDVGYDYFGLDTRKAQKHFHRFGSRDLIGRIEIIGDNPHFKEISSRDGGLVRNEYYQALVRCFIQQTLEKLEGYAVNVQFTNKEDKNKEDLSALSNITAKSALLELIVDEANQDTAELIEVDRENVSLLAKELLATATSKEIDLLNEIAFKLNDIEYVNTVNVTKTEFEKLQLEKEELERKIKEQEEARKALEKQLEEERKRHEEEIEAERKEVLFNKRLAGTNIREVISMQHHIDRASEKINKNVDDLILGIQGGLSQNILLKYVEKISLENKKIASLVQFVTNANFNVKATTITRDLNRFIKEYIIEVHQQYEHLKLNKQLLLLDLQSDGKPFVWSFRPIEIIIIIDNLFSNSQKAGAKHAFVSLSVVNDNNFKMIFRDDGNGIDDSILPRIFNLGFTTTEGGSGIGLYHVKQLLDRVKAKIEVNNRLSSKGVEFIITITKP